MERKLIVSLLQKNIQELDMITQGFMEMTEYPPVIIKLARRKTEDILDYVRQLEEIKDTSKPQEPVIAPIIIAEKPAEPVLEEEKEMNDEFDAVEDLPIAEEEEEELAPETLILEEEEIIEDETAPEDEEIQAEIEEEIENEVIEIVEETVDIVVEEDIEEELTEEIVDELDVLEEEEEQEESPEVDKPVEVISQSVEITVTQTSFEQIDNTIAGAHTNKKIDDIRQALSIGDRFRFQRELFEGNGELLNKTLSKLNQMNDFHEASAYLQSKFSWKEDDETVENFYQIVRRRFL